MSTVNKVYHIDISIKGIGTTLVKDLIMQYYPNAHVIAIEVPDNELEKKEDTELYKFIVKATVTQGTCA